MKICQRNITQLQDFSLHTSSDMDLKQVAKRLKSFNDVLYHKIKRANPIFIYRLYQPQFKQKLPYSKQQQVLLRDIDALMEEEHHLTKVLESIKIQNQIEKEEQEICQERLDRESLLNYKVLKQLWKIDKYNQSSDSSPSYNLATNELNSEDLLDRINKTVCQINQRVKAEMEFEEKNLKIQERTFKTMPEVSTFELQEKNKSLSEQLQAFRAQIVSIKELADFRQKQITNLKNLLSKKEEIIKQLVMGRERVSDKSKLIIYQNPTQNLQISITPMPDIPNKYALNTSATKSKLRQFLQGNQQLQLISLPKNSHVQQMTQKKQRIVSDRPKSLQKQFTPREFDPSKESNKVQRFRRTSNLIKPTNLNGNLTASEVKKELKQNLDPKTDTENNEYGLSKGPKKNIEKRTREGEHIRSLSKKL